MQRIPIPPIYHSWWGCSWGLFHVQSEYGEFLLLFSPPEGDVRASLVLAKYKFCGHKFNNKTYKMKKFLLFLSCFLITWCSVEAANPTGKITSATYNASSSRINVNYTTSYTSSVRLGLLSIHQGNSMAYPISPKTISTPNTYSYSSSTSLEVNDTLEECKFVVLFYINGSDPYHPSFAKDVNVTAKGVIKDVKVNTDNKTLTVNYGMQHGSSYYSSLRIYDESGKNLFYTKRIREKINESNPNTKVNNYRNYSFSYSSFADKLIPGKTYTCKLYTNEHFLYEYKFTMPIIIIPPAKTYANMIPKLTYTGGSLKIDFTLRDTGVNVGFRVHAASMSGNTGETKTYDYGRYYQHEGTYTVPVPRYSGLVIYAVELLVDGISVDGNSIQVY